MSPEKPERARPRAKRFGVEFEEERAWVTFYRRVGHDVTIAAEVLIQLCGRRCERAGFWPVSKC